MVWLDDQGDPDNPSALQQSFSNPMEPVEGLENKPMAPDSSHTLYTRKYCTIPQQIAGHTVPQITPIACTGLCV